MNKKKVVSNILDIRNNTFEIIIVTIFIAIGINLLTSGSIPVSDDKIFNTICIIIGIGLIILSLFIRTRSMLFLLNKSITINGFFIYNNDTKIILPIEQYEISKDMNQYLNSAFYEKKALEYLWNNDPLNTYIKDNAMDNSSSLLSELIEYCILKKLSNVLMTYYLNGIQDENELIEFNRNDLPDILLKNRFLNLFSEPMENRDAFIGNKDSSGITLIKDNGEESIIHKTLLDGTMFEWFNLILPKNSVVTRKNKNTISIDMHEFSIEISNCFDRINTFIDGYFYDYYLGIDFMDHSSFKFDIEIKVNFKTKALLMLKKQNYFSWIDEFIETLDEYADCNTFLKNINWKGTKSIITCYKNINKNNND